MKKVLLLASAFCLAGFVSSAQTQKGYYLIGGNIGNIGGTFQGGSSSFNFNLSPKVAWFVKDRLAIGGQVDLGVGSAKNAGTQFTYSVGPMARYYFTKNEVGEFVKHTTIFAEANVGIGGTNNSKSKVSTNGFNAGVGPGLAYFVTENVALEALAKLNLTTGFGNSTMALSPSVGVGFQVYLPTSKIKSIGKELK